MRHEADARGETAALEEAFAHCAAVTRLRARNFFYGLRLTPEPRRSAVYSVYAWMRQADDLVDEAGDLPSKHRALTVFSGAVENLIADRPLGELGGIHEWIAFRDTFRRYRLSPDWLLALVEGLRWDLACESRSDAFICADRASLERYCYCVASTVGLICVRIWGLRPGLDEAEAHRLAVIRGLAFQLTNILRDFAQDAEAGRVYLPRADFENADLTPALVKCWQDAEACAAFVSIYSSWARDCYLRSAPLDDMVDPCCAPALRAMTAIYSGILGLIEQDPSRIVGTRRVRLQSATKAGIALKAMVGGWWSARTTRAGAG